MSGTTGQEQFSVDLRQHPRLRVPAPFVCSLSRLGLAKWLSRGGDGFGVVFDVSMRGAKVMSEAGIQRGDRLSVSLSLPNQVSPMTVEEATVRWEREQVSIGRLIDHLKKIGEYDNTIFVVFGDNGAEGTDLFGMIAGQPGTRDFLFAAINWNQTHPNAWGDPGSFVGYGPMWAQVSMTPFSQYKGWLAEGGIRNALIVSGPGVRPKGGINNGLMHVADLMPTFLEIAGATYPKTLNGQPLPLMMGKPWNDVLAGKAASPRTDKDYLAWELFGNRAVRQGSWKLRWQHKPMGKADWELFDLAADPAERHDLAAKNPGKVQELVALWDDYVKRNNVILPSRGPYDTLEKDMPQRVTVYPGFPPLLNKQQFVPPKDMLAEPKP